MASQNTVYANFLPVEFTINFEGIYDLASVVLSVTWITVLFGYFWIVENEVDFFRFCGVSVSSECESEVDLEH
jgi:hypothetical protein